VPDDERPADVPVFDQLPPELQDQFLDLIATALLNHALDELDQHDTVVITTDATRKAG
jgi:hypothetical protein